MLNLNKLTKLKLNQQRALTTAHVCAYKLITVVHNTDHNSSDNLPLLLQTTIIAQTMSTAGEGQLGTELSRELK